MRERSKSVSSRSQHHAQPKVLSHQMEEELTKAEAMIEKGFKSFVQTGTELERIRDSKLYRGSYKSWAAYTRQRWNMSKTHANRLIAAARLALDKLTPSGVNFQSEHELRSLIKLTNSQFENALAKARKVATEKKSPLTVALLVRLVAKRQKKPVVVAYRRGNRPFRIGAVYDAKRNKEFVNRIRPVITTGLKLSSKIAAAIEENNQGTSLKALKRVHDFLERLEGNVLALGW